MTSPASDPNPRVWAHPWARNVRACPASTDNEQQQRLPYPCSVSTGRKALIRNEIRSLCLDIKGCQMSAIKDVGATFGTRVWSPASSCSAAAEQARLTRPGPAGKHLSPWAQLVSVTIP